MYYISFYFHEIRIRIFYTLLACIFSFVLGYIYKYELFYILSKPFLKFQKKFIFFDFTEGLYTMIHSVTLVCFLAVVPVVIYHFWSFLVPSWYTSEKKIYGKYLKIFFICVFLEFFFIYFFVFPELCNFLMSFEIHPKNSELLSSNQWSPVPFSGFCLEFTPRIASYIRIFSQFFLLCLFVFQLPFFFLGLFSRKIFNCYHLCQHRKTVLFLCVLVSAFISPPDLITQFVLSGILYSLYEIIIFVGFLKKFTK